MYLFLKVFLLFIASYHIIHTILVYGFWIAHLNFPLSGIRDVAFIIFLLVLVVMYRNYFVQFLKKYIYYFLILWLLIGWSLLLSFTTGKALYDMIIWIKYDYYFFIIFLGSCFLGQLLYHKKLSEEIYNKMKKFIRFIIVLILLWFVRQWAKFISPDFFYWLWYGPIWDYVLGQSPPLYYRTWPGGFPRLSWIFAWPNNFGYLLGLFFPLITYYFVLTVTKKNRSIKKHKIAYYVSYILSIILTFSRWLLVSLWLQIAIFLTYSQCVTKKIKTLLWGFFIFLIVGLSYVKSESTFLHMQQSIAGLKTVIEQPLWMGLGSSGPAIHYGGQILPENTYLQILIDLWIPWFLLWLSFFIILFMQVYRIQYIEIADKHQKVLQQYLRLLSLWLLGLLLEWMFLHVFEDSMINYLFFVIFWIQFGYLFAINQATSSKIV